jgi:tetratricopeptide (TPR) repeat protein
LEQLFSLTEFRHSHLIFAQNFLREAIENESVASVKRSEALLLSALEFLSVSPLNKENIGEAEKHLKEIPANAFKDEPIIGAEYRFWLAEILRSEHNITQALQSYSKALDLNVGGGFSELIRFRRAELFEQNLQYNSAEKEFDTLASMQGHVLRLYASLRRASLLRILDRNNELLIELSRAAILASDTAHLIIPFSGREIQYHSLFEEARLAPEHQAERIISPNPALIKVQHDSLLLSSQYPMVEIALLKGTAYSEKKLYDSAEYFFLQGEKALALKKDSVKSDAERSYLSHALKFERGWTLLSKGENEKAASLFLSLAKEDTIQKNTIFSSGRRTEITGPFYNDEQTVSFDVHDEAEQLDIDTAFFIYDDYPARAKFYAGIALSRTGKVEEARDILTNLSQDPSAIYGDKARYHLALVEFKSKRMFQAEVLLVPIAMKRTQTGIYASLLLGDIHYRRSSFAKAAEYFGFALANLFDNDTALKAFASLERGLSLLPLGSWNESAVNLKDYVSSASIETPGLDEALFWLGRAYFRSDSVPQARNCFKRVLDEFPNSTRLIDAQYGYAWTLFRNGEYELADKAFAKVIEMDSITRYAYDALSRRGDALYANGDIKKALAIYNLAVDRPTFNDYRTTRALYQLGVLRMKNDSAHSAMNAFRTITRKFPQSDILDQAYYNYAIAAFAIKQDDEANIAISTLTSKYKDSPFAAKGLYLAASQEEYNGNIHEAYTTYKKIINDYSSSQEFVPALFGAVNALVQLKRYDAAVALADTFFVRNPNASYSTELLYRKGEIQLLAQDAKEAEQTFQNFIALFPNDTLLPMAKYTFAKAVSIDDKNKAFDLYREVTENYPHSDAAPFAYFAMARLERNEREDNDKAAEFYTKAFDMEYYSSDAAPPAMFEYAGFLRLDLGKPDSALRIYDALRDRYFLETTIGARAQLEAAEILLSRSKQSDAITKLEKVADAQEGYELAAEARLRLGQIFFQGGSFKKALAEFDRAREDNSATGDQLGRSYIGSSKSRIAAGDKSGARHLLSALISSRSIQKVRRDTGIQLLKSITPKKLSKKKR